jgi:hypothetical protein
MSQWKNIAMGVALSAGLALGGLGCMADGSSEDDATLSHDGANVGEAREAWSPCGGPFPWFVGWGGSFPWWGKSWLCAPCGGLGGCFPGCGGCGGFGGFGGEQVEHH